MVMVMMMKTVELRVVPGHTGSSCLCWVALTNSKDRSQVFNVTPKQCMDAGIKMTPRDLVTKVMNLATVQYQLKFMITPVKDNPILPNLRDLCKIGLKRSIEGQPHLMASGSKSSGSWHISSLSIGSPKKRRCQSTKKPFSVRQQQDSHTLATINNKTNNCSHFGSSLVSRPCYWGYIGRLWQSFSHTEMAPSTSKCSSD